MRGSISEKGKGGATRRFVEGLGWWDGLMAGGDSRRLCLNGFVDATGTGLASICLPFFILRGLHLGGRDVALTLTVAGAAELLATVPAGVIAGKFGVRAYSVVARAVSGFGYVVLAFASGMPGLIFGGLLAGLGRAASGGLGQSITVAALGTGARAGALASIRALRNVGYGVSAALGSLLVGLSSGPALRLGLLINAASFAVSGALLIRLRMVTPPIFTKRMNLSVLRDRRYLILMACNAAFGSSLLLLTMAIPLWCVGHSIPVATAPFVLLLNTVLVVLLQYRVARVAETIVAAVRHVRIAALLICVAALLMALSGGVPPWGGVLLVVGAGVFLTFAELSEQSAWWTLAFLTAPDGLKNEYLAAFDLGLAMISLGGPVLMLAVIHGGSWGWAAYAAAILVAAMVTSLGISKHNQIDDDVTVHSVT